MTDRAMDIEQLLRQALQPIEPPSDLEERLEDRLRGVALAAVEELEGWELSAMRDPRRWIPTAVAAGAGASAASGEVTADAVEDTGADAPEESDTLASENEAVSAAEGGAEDEAPADETAADEAAASDDADDDAEGTDGAK